MPLDGQMIERMAPGPKDIMVEKRLPRGAVASTRCHQSLGMYNASPGDRSTVMARAWAAAKRGKRGSPGGAPTARLTNCPAIV